MLASCFLLCFVACLALSSSSSSSYSSPEWLSSSLCSTLELPFFWSSSNCAFVIFFGVPVSVRCVAYSLGRNARLGGPTGEISSNKDSSCADSRAANLVALGVTFFASAAKLLLSDFQGLVAWGLALLGAAVCESGCRTVEDEEFVGRELLDTEAIGALQSGFFDHRSPSSRCACLLANAGSFSLFPPVTNSRWLLWLSNDKRSWLGEEFCSDTSA